MQQSLREFKFRFVEPKISVNKILRKARCVYSEPEKIINRGSVNFVNSPSINILFEEKKRSFLVERERKFCSVGP